MSSDNSASWCPVCKNVIPGGSQEMSAHSQQHFKQKGDKSLRDIDRDNNI